MGMIELYVNLKPVQTFWNETPQPYNIRAVGNSSDDAGPSTTPTHFVASNEQGCSEDNEEDDEEEDDSDYQIESDEVADSGSSAEDVDEEDDEVSGEEDEIDYDAELLHRWPRHNPFVGRGAQHPIHQLNDVSGFEPSDVDFGVPSIPLEGTLLF